MAEQRGILGSLWDWVGPKAAEAEVMSTPSAQPVLTPLEAPPTGADYLMDMYKRIYQRAQAHPSVVAVMPSPGIAQRAGVFGMYVPGEETIGYESQRPVGAQQGTIAHELLHFLNAQTARLPVETQHAIIKQVLGASAGGAPMPGSGYQPPAMSPVDQSVLREWMTGERDWPRGGR